LQTEILAVRHQLNVLRRRAPKRHEEIAHRRDYRAIRMRSTTGLGLR
jgi:hypothetical protein